MTPPKGKQRSIHMDDETFDILERLAGEYKANNSTIVRMALIQFDKGRDPYARAAADIYSGAPVTREQAQAALAAPYGDPPVEPAVTPLSSILPDPKVSSFSVSGGKVRGKVPRNDREDDGLDV